MRVSTSPELIGERDRARPPFDRLVEAIVQHLQLRAGAVGHRQLRPGRQAFQLAHRLVGEMLRLLGFAAPPVQPRQPAQVEADLVDAPELPPDRDGAVPRRDDRVVVESASPAS